MSSSKDLCPGDVGTPSNKALHQRRRGGSRLQREIGKGWREAMLGNSLRHTMTQAVRASLCAGILLAALLSACGSSPGLSATSPTAVATPLPTPTPLPVLRVEPVNRKTFGLDSSFPAGTTFLVAVVNRTPNNTFGLYRCGIPCNTATNVQFWRASQYATGDQLSARIDTAGVHYLWLNDDGRNAASIIVADQVVGNRLRVTFDTGTVMEAWYVLP